MCSSSIQLKKPIDSSSKENKNSSSQSSRERINKNLPKFTSSAKTQTSFDESDNDLNAQKAQNAKTQTKKSALSQGKSSSSSSTTISSSSSKIVTTLQVPKNVRIECSSSADTLNEEDTTNNGKEEATMQEWLNPMTQSEIDYEEKKREIAAAKQRNASKNNQEREVQLNWIENEIQRLESLKSLLLKEESTRDSTMPDSTKETSDLTKPQEITSESKIYDTVADEPTNASSVLSESAERLVQEVELIIEESNEEIVNFENNIRKTKDRIRETKIGYDKPMGKPDYKNADSKGSKPRFRTVTEKIVTKEDQIFSESKEYTCEGMKL